ncbi:MAG: fibronectin type III domain-containing protein [Agriterribacter sp.]
MIFYITNMCLLLLRWCGEWGGDCKIKQIVTMYNRLLIVTLFLSIFISNVKTVGQSLPYRPTSIIPSSPTSSSLGKYGDIPVNLFNGSPNIQIPLYEIRTPGHSLQIVMRYDASGTRVKQDASWVGLGWTLEAGGAVSRVIRQKDDLDQSRWGYYYSPALPPSVNNDYEQTSNWQEDRNFFNNVHDGVYDAEPDIFSYNFCGKNGRFVIGKNGDGSSIFLDEKNNFTIAYQNNGWLFVDGEGYKYYLGTKEAAENYASSLQNELTTFNGLLYLNPDGNGNPASAWYIDSIVAPTNEKITFTYVKGKSLSLINFSEQFYKLINLTNIDCQGYTGDGLASEIHSFDYSRQDITDVYLQKIEFTNGSIEFNLSSRLDVEVSNTQGLVGPSKLDNIIIKNQTDVLSKYTFIYSYFNTASPQGRLKLDSIFKTSRNNLSIPPYKFEYYNSNNLPSKYSKSMDHWGFENGAINTTLLPSTIMSQSLTSFTGANRDAEDINNYPIKGVLSKIIYPTGGYSVFDYELHDYSNLHGEQLYKTINKAVAGYTNPELFPQNQGKDVYFTIPVFPGQTQVPATIRCSYQKTDLNNNNNDLAGLGIGTLYLLDENGNITTPKYTCVTSQIEPTNPNEVVYETSLNLVPGNYKIEMLAWTGWTYTMSVFWIEKETTPLTEKKGGGIRIKRISNFDNFGNKTVKKYSYIGDDEKSSGVLMAYPKYDNQFTVAAANIETHNGITTACNYIGNYYSIISSSIFPSGLTSRSGIVGYSKVTETDGENGENGKIEYYYHCSEETVDDFPAIPTFGDPRNGKPDSILVYTASGSLLKKTAYNYTIKEGNVLKGVKLFTAQTVTTGQPLPNSRAYKIRYYDNYSYWLVTNAELVTEYTAFGVINTVKNYYYNNNIHREPTQIDFTRSDGKTLITKYKRPDDYTVTGGNSFVEQMRGMHIISPVIEQQTFLKKGTTTKLVSGTFAKFAKFNNLFFKPSVIYDLETTAPLNDLTESSFSTNGQPSFHSGYKPKIYYDQYNALGNPVLMKGTDNIRKSYIYGYNASLPVAEVINALPSDIFYTSFEESEMGGDAGDSKTGKYSREHYTNLYSRTLTGLTNGDYILSYWRKQGYAWVFYESTVPVSNNSYTFSLTGILDEIRFYPKKAQMVTYTYEPLIGITSQCDEKNQVMHYVYDDFGRLVLVRDDNRNILKQYRYNYAGQQVEDWSSATENYVPLKVSNLAGTYNNNSIIITWVNHAYNADKIVVYRSNYLSGPFTNLTPDGISNVSDTSFIDSTVEPGKNYYYFVRVINQYGHSTSTTVKVITPQQ